MYVGSGLDSIPCLVSIIFADLTSLSVHRQSAVARAIIVRMRNMKLPRLTRVSEGAHGFRDFKILCASMMNPLTLNAKCIS